MTDGVNTLCYAALQSIKKHGLQPTPNTYEVFYVYHGGSNQALNEDLDAAVNRAALDDVYVANAYNRHLGSLKIPDGIVALAEDLARSIGETKDLTDAVANTTAKFGGAVAGAQGRMQGAGSGALRDIVAGLAKASMEAQGEAKATEQQLNALNGRIASLSAEVDSIRKDAFTDALTGVGNRRAFDRDVVEMLGDAQAKGRPLSLCLFDIDHFKHFNDTYGHPMGDQALKRVAATVQNCLREQDVVHRYGGEEFAVLMPGTNLDTAAIVIERVRTTLAGVKLRKRGTNEDLGKLTASFGLATLDADDDASALIERADALLYAAKNSGRNRVSKQEGGSSVFRFQPRT